MLPFTIGAKIPLLVLLTKALSESLLIEPDTVIENPIAKSTSSDSVRDIKISIPESAIEASKTGIPAKKDKQLEKDLKKQEKIAKQEAKMVGLKRYDPDPNDIIITIN